MQVLVGKQVRYMVPACDILDPLRKKIPYLHHGNAVEQILTNDMTRKALNIFLSVL
jgi:hypothetical protein